ncbi:MAG: hypothetical protein RL154_414 [Pseudomonadota bacterium]
MKKLLTACAITSALLFTGCGGSGLSVDNAGSLTTVNYGTVVGVRNTELSGSTGATAGGAILGAVAGAALGSLVGQGLGKDLAIAGGAAAGGLAGGYAGDKATSAPGQELKIQLDNGQMIETVYKVQKDNPHMFRDGDRVVVQIRNGAVSSISRSSR